MRALIRLEMPITAPADAVWDYVTDWPRQGEWFPQTRVELVDPGDPARRVGGRIRAWSGLGPLGFWDTMTITSWQEYPAGGGRCEVLHTGAVVRGEGVCEVSPEGPGASLLVWSEMAEVPGGRLGAVGWPAVRWVVERLITRGLRTLRDRVEQATYSPR